MDNPPSPVGRHKSQVRSIVSKCAAIVLLACSALLAQSLHGVYVGQSSGVLPPEFSEVKRGQYDARFGTERMQVFVAGALVTGINVFPQIPLTLAEAIAKYGSIADIPHMLVLLDPDGDPQGLVDPLRRISYITSVLAPGAVIRSVGFYNENTALLNWTENAASVFLQALETAANNVSLQELTARPQIAKLNARAQYMLQEALKAARKNEAELEPLLSRYQASCADAVSTECRQAKSTQAPALMQTADQFRFALKQANFIFSSNPDVFGQNMPPELARLNAIADPLLSQVPSIPAALR